MGGGDVEGLVEQAGGPLPVEQTLRIAIEVCRGLAFAHEKGVVHRDLKPGNVWLTVDGTAKIGDFGLAVNLDKSRLTQHGMMVGTVAYMPPEQALGAEITPRADLYSLGAMLYEMVAGRPPFTGDNPTAVISQHINTPPVAPSWHSDRCPADLEDLILHLLEKDPAKRPVSASEVLAALERIDPAQPSRGHSGSDANRLDRLARGVFVGRERELERLRSAFDDAFAGRGSVVMLVGEPGIGKTRTVQELETYARMRGARVIWGRAHEGAGAPAYRPWVQAADSYAGAFGLDAITPQLIPEDIAELSRTFPDLRRQPGYTPPVELADPAEARFRLFDAYTKLVLAFASEAPLVIVLDDLHWADWPTFQLLQHVAADLRRMRVLIVGTYRDTELSRTHPLSEVLATLNREGSFERVSLVGLDRTDVANYVQGTTGVEPSRALVDRVYEETEGNPFFFSEVVKLMTEEGRLTAESMSGMAIPEGIRQALGRRLDGLSEDANALLRYAAVVGREFAYETLRVLTDHDDDTLLRLIEEGLAARVIEERSQPGRYQFTHALMQETLLDELSTTRRARMHGQVGEALERRWGSLADERASRLARHFMESSSLDKSHRDKAARYAMLAGQYAEKQFAWDDAARHYSWVLEVDDPARSQDQLVLAHAGLARALLRAGDLSGAWRELTAALEVYRQAGDWQAIARLLLDCAGITASPERKRALFAEVARNLDESSLTLRARVITHLARWVSVAEAQPLLAEAIEIAEKEGLEDIHTEILLRRGFDALENGDAAGAERLLLEANEKATAAGLDEWVTQEPLADLHRRQGALDFYWSLTQVILRAAQRRRHQLREAFARTWLMDVAWVRGDLDAVATLAADMMTDAWSRTASQARLAAIAELDTSRANGIMGSQNRAVIGPVPHQANFHGLSAWLYHVTGDAPRAAAALQEWREADARCAKRSPSAGNRVSGLALAAEVLADTGDEREISAAYDLLTAGSVDALGFLTEGPHRPRGLLALRLGRIDEARAHFDAGIAWAVRERAPIVEARNLQGLVSCAESVGDHALAMQHLEHAGELFSRHGTRLYLEQVLAKKEILKA